MTVPELPRRPLHFPRIWIDTGHIGRSLPVIDDEAEAIGYLADITLPTRRRLGAARTSPLVAGVDGPTPGGRPQPPRVAVTAAVAVGEFWP